MAVPRKLTQNFAATEVDDEVLIVDLEGGELFSLSGTGRAIWQLIDGRRDIPAIAAELGRHYAATADQLDQDCRKLLGELVDVGLVALEPPSR
jgi:pyrroloquinoline quinone biosynthesis protein D